MHINGNEFKNILKKDAIPDFNYLGTISLIKDEESGSFFYRPQPRYNNIKKLDYISYRDRDNNKIKISDKEEFCKFRLDLPKKREFIFGFYMKRGRSFTSGKRLIFIPDLIADMGRSLRGIAIKAGKQQI